MQNFYVDARINSQPTPPVWRSSPTANYCARSRGYLSSPDKRIRKERRSESPDFSLLWKFADVRARIYDCGNLPESTAAADAAAAAPMAVARARPPFPNDKFLGLYPAAFIRDCLTHSLFYFSLPFRRSVGSLPSLARRALPATQYFVALTLERSGTS